MPNVPASLPFGLDRLALLLDVDGTILDIAPTPQSICVPAGLRDTLTRLWRLTGGAVAFVSGRPVSELDRIFFPLQLPAIGGHGAELRAAAGQASGYRSTPPLDSKLKRRFAAIAAEGSNVVLEDKGYSLALHYRLAPDQERAVRESAERICAELPTSDLEVLPGKAMVEIKQAGFSKASAVRELMTCPPFAGRHPVFIGDDITDRDAFAVMPRFGGIAISVGEQYPTADYCFERPAEVRRWLEQLSQAGALASS
jgi:trehalose 6-phosphate phosphatase